MSESAVHLGHRVCINDKDCILTAAKNCFRGHLICLCQIVIICIHFYGHIMVVGWIIICVAWRKVCRAIWRIHPITQCDIISAMGGQPLSLTLKSHVVTFVIKGMSCENGVVKTVAFICISIHISCAGNNDKLLLNDQNENRK